MLGTERHSLAKLTTELCSPVLNVFIVGKKKRPKTHRPVEKIASLIWKAKALLNRKLLWVLAGYHCGQFYTGSYRMEQSHRHTCMLSRCMKVRGTFSYLDLGPLLICRYSKIKTRLEPQ